MYPWKPYLTTTQKDFNYKECKPIVKNTIPQEFKDPIKEGFKCYLSADEFSTLGETEFVDDFIERLIQNKYLPFKTVDKQVVINDQLDDKRTVYDIDYCDKELFKKYLLEQAEKQKFRLPDDWDIPLSVQKISYRHPLTFNSKAYDHAKKYKPPISLGKDKKIQEILKVTTGLTEYQGVIGKTGDIIMNEKLHKHVKKLQCPW